MMQVKQINTEKKDEKHFSHRPTEFKTFIGQSHVKTVLDTAIQSAMHREQSIWHILLAGPSWYGKTTLAQVISNQSKSKLHIITWYAISKPADIISVLTMIKKNDILFIDEIHRLKPTLEEMLYIAMEDYAIDMIMPDWWNIRVPLKQFTLIWATTKPESLSEPLKNRFVYNCHFIDYTCEEKHQIIERYLNEYWITYKQELINMIWKKVDTVPRIIHNLCVKIRDYLISHNNWILHIDDISRENCDHWLQIKDWGITQIHQKYIKILSKQESPLGLRTIALQLWLNELTVEKEIEPLLIKLDKIEKTTRWRKLKI